MEDMMLLSELNGSHNITSEWMDTSYYDENATFYLDEDFNAILKDFKKSLFTTDSPVTIVLITCYVLVFVFALLGNLLVILVIVTNRTMRTSITNSYLLNLAVADLLVTLVCIPLTVGETIYKVWVYSYFLCKATNYLQGLCISASVLTIMALSLDRYMAIRHPVRSRQASSATCVRITIICIWLVSGVIMVPLAIVRSLTHHELGISETLLFCGEHWPSPTTRTAFDIFLFVFIYIMPGSVVVFSYSSTGCRLMARDNLLQRTDSDVCHGAKVIAGRRRLARMLLVLAILFAVSWMPYHTLILYMDFVSKEKASSLRNLLSFALVLGHSHSAQNPVLYCFMNRNFKRGVKKLTKCGVKSSTESTLVRRDTWQRGTRKSIVEHRKLDDKNGNKNQSSNGSKHPNGHRTVYRHMNTDTECNIKMCVKPVLSDPEPYRPTPVGSECCTEMIPLNPLPATVSSGAIKN